MATPQQTASDEAPAATAPEPAPPAPAPDGIGPTGASMALEALAPVRPATPADVTVIIPAYNEGAVVGQVVAELRQAMPAARVLVVDDGSTDSTAAAAAAGGARVLRHRRNLGYGAGLRTGILAAETPFVAIYDADGQHRPEDLARLIEQAADADMVVGARAGASVQVAARRPGKWLLVRFANLLVGQDIPDLNSGLRVIRRGVILRYLHLFPRGFSASTTMTVCLLQRGYQVKFLPITTRSREGRKSTVRGLNDGLNTLRLIVRLIVLFNPQRFFLPPALGLIALGGLYGFIRAAISREGFPTLAALVIITGLIAGMFGLLAEQISTLRLEMFERYRDEADGPAART